MGHQETMDWIDVITGFNDRILASENHNRAHGLRHTEILGNFDIIDAKPETCRLQKTSLFIRFVSRFV